MKKLIIAFGLVAVTLSSIAVQPTKREELTPEQKAARAEARRRHTGGFLEFPGVGKIAILNAQKTIPQETIDLNVKSLRDLARGVEIAVQDVEFSIATAKPVREGVGAPAAVYLIEDPALPISLIAIEDGWGVVNVAPLKAGNPDEDKLKLRFRKEFVRVSSIVFTGAKSQFKNSPLQSAQSVEDLDKIVGENFAIDTMTTMMNHLPEIGVKPGTRMTYRSACMQGLAPQPTNEYQKVIWEEIKAQQSEEPSNPMKIVPGQRPIRPRRP